MRITSHKANQFFSLVLKILVVLAAVSFIWYKVTRDEAMDFDRFVEILEDYRIFSFTNLIVLVILTILNWYFEILKWQNLSSHVRENSFKVATRESLASFTAAIFTPSRIGEYGAKCLYYTRAAWRKIIFLNFLGNTAQLFATYFFGIAGLLFLITSLDLALPVFNIILVSCLLFAPFILYVAMKKFRIRIKGYSIKRLEESFQNVSEEIKWKTIIFASIRFLIFTHQFYFLLLQFKVDVSYPLLISAVFSTYVLASIIPTMIIFDAFIKGGFAVWIFGFLEVPQIIILTVVLTVWILNFGLPGLAGSYYVLRYKKSKHRTA
ncbi:lysylphosphatidylglycerol synthase domain-containing protein [Salinimicrobium terrae]|uniref:lysylphosphatidylglycerol synthase domain-containing protein n=1 Tax=Salinimicrobium terrae TaxID=470866 RepID=UPI0004281712|nr:lysylphosphatidylglycerol synthase domain-containing protein [Salinimicrobium terrae]